MRSRRFSFSEAVIRLSEKNGDQINSADAIGFIVRTHREDASLPAISTNGRWLRME